MSIKNGSPANFRKQRILAYLHLLRAKAYVDLPKSLKNEQFLKYVFKYLN